MKTSNMLLKLLFPTGFSLVRYFADPADPAPPADPPPADPPADPPPADPPADPPAFEAPDYGAVEYPEGFELDADMIESYGEDLTAAQVTGDQAAVLFPTIKKILDGRADAQSQKFQEYYDGQRAEISKMSDEDKGFAKAAAEKFAGEDGLKALSTFEGDKVWLTKMLAGIGRAMNDDQFLGGEGGAGAEKSTTSILFPSMGK